MLGWLSVYLNNITLYFNRFILSFRFRPFERINNLPYTVLPAGPFVKDEIPLKILYINKNIIMTYYADAKPEWYTV